MTAEQQIKISLTVTTDETPTIPEARPGHFSPTHVAETAEQLERWHVWAPCSFCGGFVLVRAYSIGRERCQCGARHFINRHGEGWRKDGEQWWYM